MGHRVQPTRSETLTVMRLLADVAALKTDPAAQRQALVDGLADLFRTPMAWLTMMDDWRPGRVPRPVAGVLAAGSDAASRRYLADLAAHVPITADPYAVRSLADPAVEQFYRFGQVLPDPAAFRRFDVAAELTTAVGVVDGLVGVCRAGPGGDRAVALSLHRCRGDGPLTDRDAALHRLALTEVRRLIARGHLTLGPTTVVAAADGPLLTPRLRQVRDALRAGDKPKLIARHLGLSLWTVRDYVKAVYAHYGVNGRDELMARFIRERGGANGE